MSLSAIPRLLREEVFGRDRGRCGYCQLRQIGQACIFHIDHVIPKSKGGTTRADNLVLQCPSCSLHKSNKTSAMDPASGDIVPIFHPLREVWREHFDISTDGTCRGLTPVGRATIAALGINDLLPRTARTMQLRSGILSPTNTDD